MKSNKKLVLCLVILFIALALSAFVYKILYNKKNTKVVANTDSAIVNTTLDWEAGSKTNSKSTELGDVEINDVTQSNQQVNLIGNTTSMVQGAGSPTGAIDGDWDTYFETWPTVQGEPWWQVDMGSIKTINKIKFKYSGYYLSGQATGFITISGSADGISFEPITGGGFDALTVQTFTLPTPKDYRYMRAMIGISCENVSPNDCKRQLYEFEAYEVGATGVHTTGSTQIDGGENFWNWDSFADSKNVPQYTSVTYRYRTSPDGSSWTGWAGSIGAVTSRVGDTRYRYLQVEATLKNTDGASTPSISQYDIGYHTEIKPAAPTAQTAVVQ